MGFQRHGNDVLDHCSLESARNKGEEFSSVDHEGNNDRAHASRQSMVARLDSVATPDIDGD
jgi:hypothetical protein